VYFKINILDQNQLGKLRFQRLYGRHATGNIIPQQTQRYKRYFAMYFGTCVALVVQWLVCWPLEPTVAGQKPGQGDGFLRAIKIRSTPSSRMGSKAGRSPCRKILRHVKELLKSRRDE
jgi:hypothetical protein